MRALSIHVSIYLSIIYLFIKHLLSINLSIIYLFIPNICHLSQCISLLLCLCSSLLESL
jgi:hypothetical protein